MNTNIERNSQDQNPQMNFGVRCIASCRKILAQIEDVRDQVVAEFRSRLGGDQRVLDLAMNEAEALAWETGFPQLLFPTLATEKAYAVSNWHLRQESLRRRTAPLLVA